MVPNRGAGHVFVLKPIDINSLKPFLGALPVRNPKAKNIPKVRLAFTKLGKIPNSPFATVKVLSVGQYEQLKARVPVTSSNSRLVWDEIPASLQGMSFLQNKVHQGTTKFQITTAGTVLMAVTSRWGGGGNSGDWKKEIVSEKELKSQGWRELFRIKSIYKPGQPNAEKMDWIVLERQCKRGESFSFRTEKYLAPVLLLRK